MKRVQPVLVVCLIALWSLAGASADQPAKTHRIVYLTDGVLGPPDPRLVDAFRHALRDLGHVEGRNLVMQRRHAARPEDRAAIAAEIHALRPQAVVADPAAAFALKDALRPLPVVFPTHSDPVAAGMAATLARPGGHMTGFSYAGLELNGKRLELLKEAFPAFDRVGVLISTRHPTREAQEREVEAAADTLRLQLTVADVDQSDPARTAAGIDAAFDTFVRHRVDGVIVLQGPGFFKERRHIAALALKHRLPAMFDVAPYVEAGGLMSYAPDLFDLQRRAAEYVHRILAGASPGDLPIVQPTKFELLVNLRTVRALGVRIAPALLARVDRTIE